MRWIVVILLSVLFGCKSIQYVPIETIKTDTTYIYKVRIDSVYDKDSIYVMVKGDTITEYRYKYLYKYINNTDTIYISNIDSISVPYPVPAQLTTWQQIKVDYGGWAIAWIILLIGCIISRLVKKR